MKFIVTIAFVAGGVTSSYSQIPNASFESWTDFGSHEAPNSWYIENAPYETDNIAMVQPTMDATIGLLAAHLENWETGNGTIVRAIMVSGSGDLNHSPGFPYELKPGSLSGYYHFEPAKDDDTSYIIVRLSKYYPLSHTRVTIGEGVLASNEEMAGYEHFSVPITYHSFDYPDTATIICYAGRMTNPYSGSSLTVDNLSFDESTTGVVIIDGDELGITVSPNPTNNILSITNSNVTSNGKTYAIYDNTGKVVIQKNLNCKNI